MKSAMIVSVVSVAVASLLGWMRRQSTQTQPTPVPIRERPRAEEEMLFIG